MTNESATGLHHLIIRASFGIRHSCFVICGASAPLHLPVFHEVVWNFLEKTRRPLEHIAVAASQAHVRIGEIKLVARACDRHVEQTPFFLQRIAGIERAAAGKHAVSEPNHEDGVKLETFCLMHAGEVDGFLLVCLTRSSFRIDVADQRQLGQKFMDIFELARKCCELIEVFPAELVIREIHFRIIVVNCFYNRNDHFRWRIRFAARCDLIKGMRQLRPQFL